jgi:hypothetical protein
VVDQLVRARQEAVAVCLVQADKLAALGGKVDATKDALTPTGGLPVKAAPDGTYTVHVDNPAAAADLQPLVTANAENRDILREDLWGAFGMLVGFGFLLVLWRVLRP